MSYTPGPNVQDPLLATELLQISRAIRELQDAPMVKLYDPPDKLRDGLRAYADGTSWNPGSGEGAYMYYAAAWHFLG